MAEQKKTTIAPARKRKTAAKTASPTASVTEKRAAPARAAGRSKRKQDPAVAPLFDTAAMEAAIAVAMPPEPPVAMTKVPEPETAVTKASEVTALVPRAAGPDVASASAQVVSLAAARGIEPGVAQAPNPSVGAQAATASLRQVVAEATSASTIVALEVNNKVLDAWRAQSDAVLDLWRSALAADTLSDAVRLQATGARDAYVVAANHWKDVAETTTRFFGAAWKPLQSALTSRAP
jgi:hypothetical protein